MTESQFKKLNESVGIADIDLVRYIKSLLNKEKIVYNDNSQVTPELRDEMDRIVKLIFKMVKDKLNLKLIKDIKILKITINNSNRFDGVEGGIQEIFNLVNPISYSWVNEKGEKYASEYENLKKAFYNFQKIMGIERPSPDSKRIVKFKFQWDMSHKIKQ